MCVCQRKKRDRNSEYVVGCLLWGESSMCAWRESASVIMHGEHARQPSQTPLCVCVCVFTLCVCWCMHVAVCLLVFALSQLAPGYLMPACRRRPRSKSIQMGTQHFHNTMFILDLIWKLFQSKVSGFLLQVAAMNEYRCCFRIVLS